MDIYKVAKSEREILISYYLINVRCQFIWSATASYDLRSYGNYIKSSISNVLLRNENNTNMPKEVSAAKRRKMKIARPKDKGPTKSMIAAARIASLKLMELKFLDTDLTGIGVIAQTLEQVGINVIIQDDTEDGRTGRRVTVKSIDCKGFVQIQGETAAGNTSDWVKLMLVLDKQANKAATITATDLFVTDSILSYANLANKNRFKILWSENFTLGVSGAAASGAALVFGSDARPFEVHKLVNIDIDFDNTAATGARTTQTANSISFLAISRNGIASMAGTARIRFTDA